MKRLIVIILLLCLSMLALGQDTPVDYTKEDPKVEMADQFRKDGKIYVVIGVMVVILGGLIIYVMGVDRKITRLEKEINEKA